MHVLEYKDDVHIKFSLCGSFQTVCFHAFTLLCEALALYLCIKKGIGLPS